MNFNDFFKTIEYNENQFSATQMYQIRLGLEAGLTKEQVSIYANPKFNEEQMAQIHIGF
jgi:hypothetical protein